MNGKIAAGEKLTHGESRIKFNPEGFTLAEELKIRPSWIDAVGHVNNARYFEMVYDALSDCEQSRMAELKRLEAYFISELHKGESVTLNRLSSDSMTEVAIVKPGEAKPAFVGKLFFG